MDRLRVALDGNAEIFIVNTTAGDIHQLADNGQRHWSPAWQPTTWDHANPDTWRGPYIGLKPPGMEPVIFAPGLISSPDFAE